MKQIDNNKDSNNNNNNNQCDNVIEARRPDIILIDKKERKWIIIDIGVPADVRVGGKEREKVEKYQDLKERDWKTVENKNGRSRACSDRSPWKCHKRI